MGEATPQITHEDLDSAFKNKQLSIVFQPKVSITRLLATGAEAYIRWQHPTHGLLLPGLFLPFVEQEGRSHELTLFVLREALRQCVAWHREGLRWTIAVNVGASDLIDGTLATSVSLLLEEFDLPADALTFDLPEGEIARNPSGVLPTLLDLRARGCGLSLDSGANPCLLEDIKGLPLTELKIAGSAIIQFVESTQHAGHGRIAARLKLAKQYGIPASAVGVENEATLWALQRAGFDNAQGLYICRPLLGNQLKHWDTVWRSAAQSLAASKTRPLIEGEAPPAEAMKTAPNGAPHTDSKGAKSSPVHRPNAQPTGAEPASPTEAPAERAAEPSVESQELGKKPPLEAPIRHVPRAVRGSAVLASDPPPPAAPALVARKVPGLDKPVAMTVQNPGRQGFSLFRKRS